MHRFIVLLFLLVACETAATVEPSPDECVTRDEFDGLAERVDDVEVQVDDLGADVETLSSENLAQWERIDTNYDALVVWLETLGCLIEPCPE